MKKIYLSIFILPLLIGCSNETTSTSSPILDYAKTINIYSLNDVHGDLLYDIDAPSNGMDSISGLLKNDMAKNPDTLNITICLGDMFQGQYVSDLTKGRPIVDALNYLNCKAFIIGNHEFDWGLEEMHKYKDGDLLNGELECDFLAANILQKSINKRPDWIKPYTIIETSGHKIGLIGFMGEDIENTILPGKLDDYEILPTLPLYEKYSRELKENQGCDLILAAVHDYRPVYKAYAETEIPPATIFGAHTHTFNLEYVENSKLDYKIPFVQAGCDNQGYSKLTYEFNDDKKLENVKAELIKNDHPDDYIDENLKDLIETNYASAITKGDEIIKAGFKRMTRLEWTEYVADAICLAEGAESDIGCVNFAGIRYGTDHASSDNLFAKQMIRVLPYENKILHVKIAKDVLNDYMKTNETNYFCIKNDVKDRDYYLVNITDFAYNFPADREVWKHGKILKTLDLKIRDYIQEFIQNNA